MIEFKNVSFSYGDKDVLKNISFRVEDSESLVIMGPSGSGKSTILRLALGLECPQKGEIFFDNKNICVMKESEKREIRKRIGMVFQQPNPFPKSIFVFQRRLGLFQLRLLLPRLLRLLE